MFRSVVILVGLITVAASADDFTNVLKKTANDIDAAINGAIPCTEKSYHCTGNAPSYAPYCCTLAGWLLNDGLWIVTIPVSAVILVLLGLCFICCCCRCCC